MTSTPEQLPILVKPLAALALTMFALTGCATAVPMEAAENANAVECAEVTVRLPGTVADQSKRETNAQATGAWGEPASILLRCGIEPMGPTTLPCININGVDWVRDESQAPLYRFEAYGREPGLEVIVDGDAASGTSALVDLGPAVSKLPQKHECVSIADSFDLD